MGVLPTFFFFSKMFGYSSCTFPCKFCKQFVEFYKFIISLFNFTKLPTGILTSCWIYRLIWEEWHLNDIEYSNPWTWLSLFLRSLIFLMFSTFHIQILNIFLLHLMFCDAATNYFKISVSKCSLLLRRNTLVYWPC